MSRFFYLKKDLFHTYFAPCDKATLQNPEQCRQCGSYLGPLRWMPPYRAEIELHASTYGDLAFGPGEELLVSERFRDLYVEEQLLGIDAFTEAGIMRAVFRGPRKPRTAIPRYFVALPVRSRATIDHVASGFEWEEVPRCPECMLGRGIRRWRGIVIKSDTWSGEDIFRARGAGGIYASTRFLLFCERNKISNATFIYAPDYAYDFFPWDKGK